MTEAEPPKAARSPPTVTFIPLRTRLPRQQSTISHPQSLDVLLSPLLRKLRSASVLTLAASVLVTLLQAPPQRHLENF